MHRRQYGMTPAMDTSPLPAVFPSTRVDFSAALPPRGGFFLKTVPKAPRPPETLKKTQRVHWKTSGLRLPPPRMRRPPRKRKTEG